MSKEHASLVSNRIIFFRNMNVIVVALSFIGFHKKNIHICLSRKSYVVEFEILLSDFQIGLSTKLNLVETLTEFLLV